MQIYLFGLKSESLCSIYLTNSFSKYYTYSVAKRFSVILDLVSYRAFLYVASFAVTDCLMHRADVLLHIFLNEEETVL